MRGDRKYAPKFRVVAVDAWADADDGWSWNDVNTLFEFRSDSLNLKRVFLRRLRAYLKAGLTSIDGMRHPVDLGRGWYYVSDDFTVMEVCSRKDHCPYYACIRESPQWR